MRFIGRIAAVPFGIALIVFAIANRGLVEISLDPLPFVFAVPIYAVVIAVLVVGFLAGAVAAWLRGHGARRLARTRQTRIRQLERDLERAQARPPPARDPLARDKVPALPPTANAA